MGTARRYRQAPVQAVAPRSRIRSAVSVAINAVQCPLHLQNRFRVDRVIDRLCLAAGLDQLTRSEFGKVLGQGHNRRVQQGSVVLHGEMDALENAGRQSATVYQNSVLYTTLSPCPMCTGAILLYGIPHVIIGENKTFMGDEDLLRSRGVTVEVLNDEECIQMMETFIKENPELWNEDIME